MIREGLDTIAESEEVRRAVKDVSAEYVLLLDQGVPYDEGKWLLQTTEDSLKRWDGINRITDETPGFETVLSDGDMRLYKITGTDDGGASGEKRTCGRCSRELASHALWRYTDQGAFSSEVFGSVGPWRSLAPH